MLGIFVMIGENQYLSKGVINFSELYIKIYAHIFSLYCVVFYTLYVINETKSDKDRSKTDTSKADTYTSKADTSKADTYTSKADTEKNIPILISIEGNIGTGKSTLIERYKLELSLIHISEPTRPY